MTQLELFVFGPPRLVNGGHLIDLGLRKSVALAVYLAVSGQPHSREALATLLWPEHDQREGRSRLRHALHRVNDALGPGFFRAEAEMLGTHPEARLWVDSVAFARQVAAALPVDLAAFDQQRLAKLEQAAALHHDDFLAGFTLPDAPAFDEWQFFERERLRQLFGQALTGLTQAHEAQGGYEPAIGYARRWLALDQLHEPAHRCLMRLYAAAGSQAAALRQYDICQQLLRDELGAEPEPETRRLYDDIKARRLEPGVDGRRQTAGEPAHTGWLPRPLASFVGRGAELSALQAFLAHPDVRLVSLTGPGGVGKTRLALEVARRLEPLFPDGVVLVNLAAVADPDMLLPTLAHQLGMREGSGQSLLTRLQLDLRDKRLLLVLDNFEQIVAAAPHLVELLAGTRQLTLLVTSRAALLVTGEQEYPLAPLVLPEQECGREQLLRYEAVQLFVERVRAARPDIRLTDDSIAAIALICRRLDGLPLAIELAAARIRVLTPQALLGRLERRLPLSSLDQHVVGRHRTLRDTVAWSYDLLEPDEQQLFRRLAVFVGGCTLEAAEAVCNEGDNLDVLEGVAALTNNSLLRQEEADGQFRFDMLETIREYALERLVEAGEAEAARRQHARYYAGIILNQAGIDVYSPAATCWLDWFERERDNIRAALTWSQTPEGVELGPPLVENLLWFWYRRGYFHEGRTWSKRVLASSAAQPGATGRAMAIHGDGLLAMWQGDLHEAAARLAERLAIVRAGGDDMALSTALMNLGTVMVNMGNDAAAYAYLKEAQALCEHSGHTYFYAITLVHLGNAALGLGNLAEARSWLDTAHRLSREIGENWLLAFVLNNLGELARVQGEYRRAGECYAESEALLRATGDQGDRAHFINSLGYVAQREQAYDQARARFHDSLQMFRKLGNARGIAEALAGLAGLYARAGAPQEGAMLLGAAQASLAAAGAAWWPADRVEYERNRAALRDALAEGAFEAAWASGQAMSLDQAVARALAN